MPQIEREVSYGQALMQGRVALGLSQFKVASLSGLTVNTVSNAENDRPMMMSTLKSVLGTLGQTVAEAMADAGLTAETVAQRAKCSTADVERLTAGQLLPADVIQRITTSVTMLIPVDSVEGIGQ